MRVALLAAAAVGAAARTRDSFDLGWRFHLGSAGPSSCNASAFPVPLDDVQCLGLTQQPAAGSAAACVAACCGSGGGCSLWQYSAGAGCWTGGGGCATNLTGSGWVGGTIPPGPAPPPACTPGSPCDPAFDDGGWRGVNVPHDSAIEGTFDARVDPNKGALAKNVSWYRRHFTLPAAAADDLVWLTFDGVFRSADVYVNGAFVTHHEEGYTGFVAYLHNASAPLAFGGGDNVVAVFVDGTVSELWCFEGQGIYRHVWLETAPQLSFAPWSLFGPSYVSGAVTGTDAGAPQTADGAALLPQVDVANAGAAPAVGTVTFALVDAAGATALSFVAPFNVSARGGWARVAPGVLPFGSAAAPVRLWNIAREPPLYTLTATLALGDGAPVDALSVRVGVRSAVFDARAGFLLNGVKVLMRGTSNHLGFGGTGMAAIDRIDEFRVSALAGIGANAFRTAHNPVAPELLDVTDAYGVLVWCENRFITAGVQPVASPARGGPRTHAEAAAAAASAGGLAAPPRALRATPAPTADPRLLLDAQDMVLQARNHPSIVVWSLCNELGCVADSPDGGALGVAFKLALYAVDPSRPVTGNTVQSPYLEGRLVDAFSQAMDVQAFSYEYGAYSAYKAAVPWKAVGGGESASCVTDRGYYGPPNGTAGHLGPSANGGLFACAQAGWEPAATAPYVFGNFAWTGLDYYGEVYPLSAPDVSSHFGIFDLAGFAKDGADYYRAWWRPDAPAACDDPAAPGGVPLAVSPSEWTAPVAAGAPVDVTVTTCATAADLFVNGVRQGPPGPPRPVPRFGFLTWNAVAFEPGNVTAVAYDASGRVVATRAVVTAGAPFALAAWVEAGYRGGRNGSVIAADGRDAALVGASVVDRAGRAVPNADVNVTFTVAGPGVVVGVANGDPADRSPPKAAWRRTFHGLVRAVVGSADAGARGTIVLTAAAPGLVPASVEIFAE